MQRVPEATRARRGSAKIARTLFIALPLIAGVAACGASYNAIYEGDIRFEHCMALDSGKDVKPTIRKACWEEWTRFYTFGQTRDRVDYAKLRVKQLSAASDFDEGAWAPAEPARQSVAPEPTSVLAPPPMTLATDAGAQPDATAPAPSASAPAPFGAGCADECQDGWNLCRQECKTPVCEKNCTTKYRRCMRKCF